MLILNRCPPRFAAMAAMAAIGLAACSEEDPASVDAATGTDTGIEDTSTTSGTTAPLDESSSGEAGPLECNLDLTPLYIRFGLSTIVGNADWSCVPQPPVHLIEDGTRVTRTDFDCGDGHSPYIEVEGRWVDFGEAPVRIYGEEFPSETTGPSYVSVITNDAGVLAISSNNRSDWSRYVDVDLVHSADCCMHEGECVLPFGLEGVGPDGAEVTDRTWSIETVVVEDREYLVRMVGWDSPDFDSLLTAVATTIVVQ